MEGRNYQSQELFIANCLDVNRLKPLNAAKTLARIYPLPNISVLADKLGIQGIPDALKKTREKGVARRYVATEKIKEAATSKAIGAKLSELDHEFSFPFISYLGIPNDANLEKPNQLLELLKKNNLSIEDDKRFLFNSLTNPPGRSLKLESIRKFKDESIVSLLYTCTRTLISPNKSNTRTWDNCFVCRLPVLVKFIFDYGLIEISLPDFYEPIAGPMRVEGNNPERYQILFREAADQIEGLTNIKFKRINFDNISLHLELKCGAVDMGWQIEPQASAWFDLKQNVIPLKSILSSFAEDLAKECAAKRVKSPLADVDLYKIFRAIKEQGYTSHMVQEVPLIPKRKQLKLSVLYGKRDKALPPILCIHPYHNIYLKELRFEIYKSQKIEYNNPYKLNAILPKVDHIKIDIPFDKIGIPLNAGQEILKAIQDQIFYYPDKPIDIQNISQQTNADGRDIKNILYFLLNKREIRATFAPYHKECGKPLGEMEKSVDQIRKNLDQGYYCSDCHNNIDLYSDIDIIMFFWGIA